MVNYSPHGWRFGGYPTPRRARINPVFVLLGAAFL
jgi:hypothetical protein